MERINDTAQNEKGAHGVMNIEALSVKYGKKTALDGVSFTIRPRGITAVIGPSGCGKTTLLHCMNGMLRENKDATISGHTWNRGDELKAELVRQLARQWFGALVGSNPVREPWLQVTLSEYAELLWVESTQGHKAYLNQLNAQAVPALRVTIPGGLAVDSAADRFSARSEFQTIVIDRGIAVMHELRETMGEEAFLEALRLYAQANAGSLASIADFAAAMDEAAGRRLDEYLVGQLQTISDYAGHDVQPYD